MFARTKKYDRLPPEPGIPFTGFEFAEIQSRKPVANKIQEFVNYCMQDARSPAARIILGEWGEGKSEAYVRYIQPSVSAEKAISYDISAPTIIETYRNPSRNERIRTLASPAVQFLTAVFWAISDDMKARKVKDESIPSIDNYKDQVEWLDDILKAHSKKHSRIFIFVDQVEELLLDFDVLKWFLIGLRETIDGKFFSISEKGRFPGAISFFLSCTPDAYNRMLVDPRISEIIGGQQRRLGSIELTPVGRKEALKFFHDLLKYSYSGNMPKTLPFRSAGVLNSLFTATRGNLGAMVSLFTKTMRAIPSAQNEIEVVDGEYVTERLADEAIAVYGGTTNCVDKDMLLDIESRLRAKKAPENAMKMFLTLIGELKPFSIVELEGRFRLSATEVFSQQSVLNQVLGEIVPRTVIKVFPLKENVTFNNVLEKLKALHLIAGESGEQVVQFDNYRENVREFEDRITSAEFENSDLAYRVFLPLDVEAFQTMFEGISNETCVRLRKHFETLVKQNERYLVASSAIVDRLYPIPVSPWLQFVRNREIRQRIWRDVRANFTDYFKKAMNQAFLSLFERVEFFDKVEVKSQLAENLLYINLHDRASNVWIRTLLIAAASLTESDVKEFEQRARSLTPRPNLILVFHTDDLDPQVRDKLMDAKWPILPFKLHPTYAKNLLAIYTALEKFRDSLDETMLQDAVRMLASQIQVIERISEWMEIGKKKGEIITDLKKSYANNDDELVDTLKFYVNFLGNNMTPEQAFKLNFDRLLRFVPFGLKPGLAADIETVEQLEKITSDLQENAFLHTTSDGKVQILFHPVEKKILEILGDKHQITPESLEEYFIISAAAKRILAKAFVELLIHKGLVDSIDEKIVLNDVKSLQARVEKDYRAYRTVVDSLLAKSKDYAHVFVTKQRDERLIILSEFDESMKTLHEDTERGTEYVRFQALSLLGMLMRHFESYLRPKFEASAKRKSEILTALNAKFSQFKQKFSEVVQSYNRVFGSTLTIDNIKEYEGIEELKDQATTFSDKPLQAKELVELFARNRLSRDAFDHRHYRSAEFLFNLKIAVLEARSKNFDLEVDTRSQTIGSVSELLKSISDKDLSLNSKMFTFKPNQECIVTTTLLANMQTGYSPIEKKAKTPTQHSKSTFRLSEIQKDLKAKETEYVQREAILSPVLDAIKDLHSSEIRFITDCSSVSSMVKTFCSNMDSESFEESRNNLSKAMSAWPAEYGRLQKQASTMEIETKKIRAIQNNLDDGLDDFSKLKKDMERIWENYRDSLSQRMDDLEEIFSLLRKQDLPVNETKHKAISKRIADLKETAEKIKPWEGKMEVSLLEEHVLSIQTEASKILPISPAEALVLHCLLEQKRLSDKDWISLEDLEHVVKKKDAEIDVQKVVDDLLKKHIVAPGISFVAR
jgi:hypothetical protein